MKKPHRPDQPPTDPVTVRRGWRPTFGYLAVALGLAAVGLFLWMSSDEADGTATPKTAAASSSPSSEPFVTWTPPPLPAQDSSQNASQRTSQENIQSNAEGNADTTRDLSFYLARGEKPTMREVIDRLHQADVYTGLGAFSPPGTRPPLVGLAVPEDFVLPPGYVRHYQTTDDGQRIEAILMYAPDYQPVDAANRPIPVPKDRVVPPEHAPPGLPIRRIEIPAPLEQR